MQHCFHAYRHHRHVHSKPGFDERVVLTMSHLIRPWGPTSHDTSARCNAVVPDLSATAYLLTTRWRISCSNTSASGPSGATEPERIATRTYCSSSSVMSGSDRRTRFIWWDS